jgi:hypothetical protein
MAGWVTSTVPTDFLLIDELKHWRDQYTLDKPALRRALEALGDEAAGYLKSVLAQAAKQYPKVIVATHTASAASLPGRIGASPGFR